MAYLDKSNFQQNKEYLMTGDTRPAPDTFDLTNDIRQMPIDQAQQTGAGGSRVGGGASISPAPSMSFDTTSAPETQTETTEKKADGTTKTTTTTSKPIFKTTGSANLFDPLSSGAQQGQEALNQAATMFREQAGPSRTFESIGGSETINQAVDTGQNFGEARGLANAQYQGPQGLDTQKLAELQLLEDQLRTRKQALSTGGGLASLLQQQGLTRGEAEFEAKRRLKDSKTRARDLGFSAVNPFTAQLRRQAADAAEFADQREAEEQAIRDAARGILTGREGQITEDLQQKIDEASAQQRGATEAYADVQGQEAPEDQYQAIQRAAEYLQTGRADDPGDIQGQEAAELFNTPARQLTIEGRQALQDIMNDPRYASVKDYDPLGQTTTKRGKGFYGVKDEEGNVTDLRQIEKDPAKRALLYERQRKMEALAGGRAYQQGKYSVTNPLYYGDEFQRADARSYLGFDPGTRPSRENLSSEEQRSQFNRINDLLGELDRIGDSQPFRAAKIYAEADRYLADEEKALEERGDDLTKRHREWIGLVKKARKNYKKKKAKPYAQLGGILGSAVLGSVLPGVGHVAGYQLGEKAGYEIAT